MITSPVLLGTLAAALVLQTDTPPQGQFAVGVGSVGFNLVNLATFSGTISFQANVDGQSWFGIAAYPMLASGILGSPVLSTTLAGQFVVPVLGYAQVRAVVTAYTSGIMQATADLSGSALAGQAYANTEGLKPSYAASISGFGLATAGTDLLSIQGSPLKTVRVTRVLIGGTVATAAQYCSLSLIKRTTSGSGGTTGSAPSMVALDSTDAVASAAVAAYAVSPTSLGTSLGIVASQRYFGSLTGTPALLPPPAVFDFGVRPARCPVLRGTSQYLFVNVFPLTGGLSNASTWDVTVEWTEE